MELDITPHIRCAALKHPCVGSRTHARVISLTYNTVGISGVSPSATKSATCTLRCAVFGIDAFCSSLVLQVYKSWHNIWRCNPGLPSIFCAHHAWHVKYLYTLAWHKRGSEQVCGAWNCRHWGGRFTLSHRHGQGSTPDVSAPSSWH